MRFTTYTKYKGSWLESLNLQGLLDQLSDFLLQSGFAKMEGAGNDFILINAASQNPSFDPGELAAVGVPEAET